MPVFTLEESNYAGPIPDDEILPARVTGVSTRKKPFKDDDGNDIFRVEFAFVIETPGEAWDGQRIWGDTSTIFTNNPNCKLYAWSQELLGDELPPGYVLDTDNLIGAMGRIVVGRKEYEKDGKDQVRNYVKDVIRVSGRSAPAPIDDEEPF
jgi:hypothetical protein